jgi:hypothetical protein
MNIGGCIWIGEKQREDGKVMREGRNNWPVHMGLKTHMK